LYFGLSTTNIEIENQKRIELFVHLPQSKFSIENVQEPINSNLDLLYKKSQMFLFYLQISKGKRKVYKIIPKKILESIPSFHT
jgi:hypothetical protein